MIRNDEKNVTQLYKILKDEYDVLESTDQKDKVFATKKKNQNKKRDKSADKNKNNKK
jgi:hypothetical protein